MALKEKIGNFRSHRAERAATVAVRSQHDTRSAKSIEKSYWHKVEENLKGMEGKLLVVTNMEPPLLEGRVDIRRQAEKVASSIADAVHDRQTPITFSIHCNDVRAMEGAVKRLALQKRLLESSISAQGFSKVETGDPATVTRIVGIGADSIRSAYERSNSAMGVQDSLHVVLASATDTQERLDLPYGGSVAGAANILTGFTGISKKPMWKRIAGASQEAEHYIG